MQMSLLLVSVLLLPQMTVDAVMLFQGNTLTA